MHTFDANISELFLAWHKGKRFDPIRGACLRGQANSISINTA